mgnify:CR=1 FL=1
MGPLVVSVCELGVFEAWLGLSMSMVELNELAGESSCIASR